MPVYDFSCIECHASREVRVDYETKKGLELLCVHCGGVMRAVPAARVNIISLTSTEERQQSALPAQRKKAKACGHTYHCRCSVKLTRPNPFQKEIEKALRETELD